MTSKNFSSKGLLLDSMRRNLWALVLSGVGFFLTLLLPTVMTAQNAIDERVRLLRELPQAVVANHWANLMEDVGNMLGGQNPFPKLALLMMAVACGVALFAYLHSRQKVDFYHSLPISRTQLFVNNFLTGICCTLSTYIIVLALTVGCTYAIGFGEAVNVSQILSGALSNIIVFLLVYALSVLAAVLCGNTIISLLLLAWIAFVPIVVNQLWSGLCDLFYETYYMIDSNVQLSLRLTPVLQIFGLDGLQYTNAFFPSQSGESAAPLLVGYLIAAVVAAALGLWLFRIRRSERAGTAIAFHPIRVPLKVFMCAVMGTAFAAVFHYIAGGFWLWVGLVVGVVLCHWIVEIIYAFDFHAIFGKPVHMLAILAVLAAGLFAMQKDVTGYDTWLPDRAQITAADMSGSSYYSGEIDEPALTTPENLDAIYQLMQEGIKNLDRAESTVPATTEASSVEPNPDSEVINYRGMIIGVRVGNAVKMRYYTIAETPENLALIRQIESSEEFIRAHSEIFTFLEEAERRNSTPILQVTTTAADGTEEYREITAEAEAQTVVEALREEMLARSENARPVLHLEMRFADDGSTNRYYWGDMVVTNEDARTLALIGEYTGLAPTALNAAEFDRVEISFSVVDTTRDRYYWQGMEITDPAEIAALLANAVPENLTYTNDARRMLDRTSSERTFSIVAQSRFAINELYYIPSDYPTEIVSKYRELVRADLPEGVVFDDEQSGVYHG